MTVLQVMTGAIFFSILLKPTGQKCWNNYSLDGSHHAEETPAISEYWLLFCICNGNVCSVRSPLCTSPEPLWLCCSLGPTGWKRLGFAAHQKPANKVKGQEKKISIVDISESIWHLNSNDRLCQDRNQNEKDRSTQNHSTVEYQAKKREHTCTHFAEETGRTNRTQQDANYSVS